MDMSRTSKERRARRRRSRPEGKGSGQWEALARFDLPEDSTASYRERALDSIRRAGLRFGIRILPAPGRDAAKPTRRNTLLD